MSGVKIIMDFRVNGEGGRIIFNIGRVSVGVINITVFADGGFGVEDEAILADESECTVESFLRN